MADEPIEIECNACGALCLAKGDGQYEVIIRDDSAQVERLKKDVKRLRQRLRAVKRYHEITDSHIDSLLRMGYGS